MNNELENNNKYLKEKAGNKPGFSIPKDYFKGIEDDFLIKLKEDKLASSNSFDIPDTYFDTLETEILAKVAINSSKETKVITLKSRILKFIPATVAASLLLFTCLQFFNNQKKRINFEDLSYTDIETWFDETASYTDTTELAFVYESNTNENELTLLNIHDDAIEDYFNTIDDHADLLNEIQ